MELSSNLEREYTATVMGTVNAKEMNDKLTAGVDTSEGKFAAKLVTVRHITDEEVKKYLNIGCDSRCEHFDYYLALIYTVDAL